MEEIACAEYFPSPVAKNELILTLPAYNESSKLQIQAILEPSTFPE